MTVERVAGDDDVDGEVVAVDPPAPRLVAVGVAEHPHPVAVAVGPGAGGELAAYALDLDRADRELGAQRRVRGPEQLQDQGVLGRAQALHGQTRAGRRAGSSTR